MRLEYIRLDEFVFDLYKRHIENVETKYMVDTKSKETYRAIIEYRASTNEFIDDKYVSNGEEYFDLPQFRYNGKKENMVDAGAFVGDTVEKYLSYRLDSFHKIYAFEPCIRPFKGLQTRVNRLVQEYALDMDSIVCECAALSDENGYCLMEHAGMVGSGSFIGNVCSNENHNKVPMYRLDDYLDERLDFLKADVEGNELKLLKGASNLIKSCKPRMAICIYHTPFDLFEIPEYIRSIVPEYKMAVRHYSSFWTESILYCWV